MKIELKRDEKKLSEKRPVKYYECEKCGNEWCMKELQSYKFLNDNNHWAYKCPNYPNTFFYIYDSNERFKVNTIKMEKDLKWLLSAPNYGNIENEKWFYKLQEEYNTEKLEVCSGIQNTNRI